MIKKHKIFLVLVLVGGLTFVGFLTGCKISEVRPDRKTVDTSVNTYEKEGIRPAINASGGSITPPEVFKAMGDAYEYSLKGSDLRNWAGKAIAEATGAEADVPFI